MEARRLVDTPIGFWLLVGSVGAAIIAVVLASRVLNGSSLSAYQYVMMFAQVAGFALTVIAVDVATSEWRNQTALVTYTQDPRRGAVLVAKIIVLESLALAFAVLAVGTGLVVGFSIGLPMPDLIGLGTMLAWIAGYLSVSVIFGAAIGAAFQVLPLALGVAFLAPQFIPFLLRLVPGIRPLGDWLEWALPLSAATETRTWEGDMVKFAVALTVWLAVPLAIGFWRNARKDVG